MPHPLLVFVATGLFSGLNSACWGAYKDSPYESFSARSFLRSIVIACLLGVLAYHLLPDASDPSQWLPAFLVIVGLERTCTEFRKCFFLDLSQEKYRIPQAFALFGDVISSHRLRTAIGLIMIALVAAINFGFDRIFEAMPFPLWIRYLLIASMAGMLIAIGGAWKDAPIEGFSVVAFFRSIAVCLALNGILFIALGVKPTRNLFLTVLGAERLCCEFYKTFVRRRAPGKFVGGVTHHDWLRRRRWFIPLYASSVIYLVLLLQLR